MTGGCSVPETTFIEWMEHELPDLWRVPDLWIEMYDKFNVTILSRHLTRTSWDHVWHEIHHHAKPGNRITIVISQDGAR